MSVQGNVQERVENSVLSAWYSWVDASEGFIVLDGGLGFFLMERGNDLGRGSVWSGRLLYMNPEELRAVAMSWLSAGADIITTATYQFSEELIQKELNLSGEEVRQLMISSWSILDSARQQFFSSLSPSQRSLRRYPKVAVSFGPFSAVREEFNEYTGLYENVSQDDFHHFHHQRAIVFARYLARRPAAEVDILCYETIGNPSEAVAIAETMSRPELRGMPYWMSFQCRDSSRLASGASLTSVIHDVLNACQYKNLVAIGVNCVDVQNVVTLTATVQNTLRSYMALDTQRCWRVDTIAYPNSGEIWSDDRYVWESGKSLLPPSWASLVRSTQAKILGGCCRTFPEHISALNLMRLSASTHTIDE